VQTAREISVCCWDKEVPQEVIWRIQRLTSSGLAQIPDGEAGIWEYLFAYGMHFLIEFSVLSARSTDRYNSCSGIHRGMGTHISRVKSVDLDAWTDEQLQSVLRWGNSRANKSVAAPRKLKGRDAHKCEGIGRQSWRLDMFRLKRMYHFPIIW